MAFVTSDHHPLADLASALLAPLRAAGRFLVDLAGASTQARALNRIAELSDEELSMRGLTRNGEICRILGAASAA